MTSDPELDALADRLTPQDLPRVATFFATYLGDDLERVHGSAARAAYVYATEAELDELEELAAEWERFAAIARRLPLARLNRLLRERFGTAWYLASPIELDAVAQELERALRE